VLKYLERGRIIVSEIGVAEMIHFADLHSYAGVKCLYTFPTNRPGILAILKLL